VEKISNKNRMKYSVPKGMKGESNYKTVFHSILSMGDRLLNLWTIASTLSYQKQPFMSKILSDFDYNCVFINSNHSSAP
jgi:hypothetical protein